MPGGLSRGAKPPVGANAPGSLRSRGATCLLAALLASVPARAQQLDEDELDEEELGATANVQAPVTARASEDATAAATVIVAGEREQALVSLSEALREVPGARVQSTGGYGALSTIALRSGQANHVRVLLDTIPLDTPDSGAFDLSLVPLALLDRVEVYRGGAPVWWSDGAIGGVVRLVPAEAHDTHARAELGYASFGHYQLALTHALARSDGARPALLAHAHLSGADNDYLYEGGVRRFVAGDEQLVRQRNARLDAGDGMLHAGIDAGGGRLSLLLAAAGRSQGLPGPLAQPAEHAHRQLIRMLVGAGYLHERIAADGERSSRFQLSASVSQQSQRVSDRGELDMSQDVESDDLWRRATVRTGGGLRVLPWLEPSLVASASIDGYAPDDPLAVTPARASRRSNEALAFEPRVYGMLGGVRAELRPSARIELSQASIHDAADAAATRSDAVAPTFRLAGLLAPLPALAFSASAASGKRLPSLFELFGDRAFVAASPELQPERSRTLDAGVTLAGRAGVLHGQSELRGFVLWVDDLIHFERDSEHGVRAVNDARARVAGVELGLDGGLGEHLRLSASLSAQGSQNALAQTLPLQPGFELFVRPELDFRVPQLDRAGLFVELQHTGIIYLDDSHNSTSIAPRTLVGFGASIELLQRRLVLQARVRNAFDQLSQDVLSRPLPGREILLSLALTERYRW